MKRRWPMALALGGMLSAPLSQGKTPPLPAPAPRREATDALAPAHAALRSLQFSKAIALLSGMPSNAAAQYLLALMYLNGVGVPPDPTRARALLSVAADHGSGPANFVLAAEYLRDDANAADASQKQQQAQGLLQRAAQLGYMRAIDAIKTGRPLWARETPGATDPALFTPWVLDCARNDDAVQLKKLGPKSAQVRDDFGRGALHYAAGAGALAGVTVLLDMGADVRAADGQGVTALMLAAENKDAAVTRVLLAHGADPKSMDLEQRTPVSYAARANRVEALRLLAQAGAPLDARDARGYNALDAALTVQASDAAAELRSVGVRASITPAAQGRQSAKIDAAHPGDVYRGWPPLALALARNDTQVVQQQLDGGADANARLPQGDTLLQVAADAHALASLNLLLARGANPLEANHAGHSVLWLAAVRADLPLVEALLAAGIKPDSHTPREEAPLLAATRAVHAAVALALLDAGADVGASDAQGRTALMIAGGSGQRSLVSALLAHHADTEIADGHGRTALWYASAAGSAQEVTLLLAGGAKISAGDAAGLGPLHAAAAQPNARVLESLIDAHAPLNARSSGGDSALMVAAANGRSDVVRALLAHGPALDLQNSAGDTALIAASRGGYAEVCKLLVNAGADKSLRNRAGVAAADVASSRGFGGLAASLAG